MMRAAGSSTGAAPASVATVLARRAQRIKRCMTFEPMLICNLPRPSDSNRTLLFGKRQAEPLGQGKR